MRTYPELNKLIQNIEQKGIDVNNEIHGFAFLGVHLSFPGVASFLCLRGTARVVYDMQEITIEKNDLLVLLPGHFLRVKECSDDFTYARSIVSSELLKDIKAYLFSHDTEKFGSAPICRLTDTQANRLYAISNLLYAIAMHDTADLQLRQQMLLTQLAVGFEFTNYYRKEQDRQMRESQTAAFYCRFCNLVVAHYREQRDVKFYAAQLGYSTRYFSKIFLKASNGITALDYIGQYVCAQAKRIMDTTPHQTVKATALELGFPNTGNFCRYFKRVTGIYPQEYRRQK